MESYIVEELQDFVEILFNNTWKVFVKNAE